MNENDYQDLKDYAWGLGGIAWGIGLAILLLI